MPEHKFASTTAAQMLAHGLRSASQERGVSLREIGRRLSYKQPVVLSHMATGRVQIPLERAAAIATEVELPVGPFLMAVLEQRHPEVAWEMMTGRADPFATELERTAGRALSKLSAAHHKVLRDVVRDSHPEERWLSISEIAAVTCLRELFPALSTDGLSDADYDAIRLAANLRLAESISTGDSEKQER